MGHSTKRQNGQMEKSKNKLYVVLRKAQGETPT
jgi:hypothetical protein